MAAKLQFQTDADEAEQRIERLTNRLEQLEEKAEHTSRASRRRSQEAADEGEKTESAWGKATGAMGGFLAGAVSVGAAVAAIAEQSEKVLANMREAGQATRENNAELVDVIVGSGNIGSLDQTVSDLRNFEGTDKERAAAFGNVTGVLPQADRSRAVALAGAALDFRTIGQDVGTNATLLGNLEQLTGGGKSVGDLQDLAAVAGQLAGDDLARLTSSEGVLAAGALRNAGLDQEQALAVVLGGLEANVGPGELKSLAPAIGRLREESGLSATDATRELLTNAETRRALLGEGGAATLGNVDFGNVAGIDAQLRRAQTEDAFAGQQRAFRSSVSGLEFLQDRELESLRDRAERRQGQDSADLTRFEQAEEINDLYENSIVGGLVREYALEPLTADLPGFFSRDAYLYGSQAQATRQNEELFRGFNERQAQLNLYRRRQEAGQAYGEVGQSGALVSELKKIEANTKQPAVINPE